MSGMPIIGWLRQWLCSFHWIYFDLHHISERKLILNVVKKTNNTMCNNWSRTSSTIHKIKWQKVTQIISWRYPYNCVTMGFERLCFNISLSFWCSYLIILFGYTWHLLIDLILGALSQIVTIFTRFF